jgi:ParB-like chromosome segregation protein Spo0J
MQTETVPIDSLSPDPANARKHDERNLAAIRDSLRAFGQQKPIVVDQREVVIAGNGTLEAAKGLGWTEIAIVRTTLDQTQATAFGIADNRTAELAEWDDEVLRSLLDSMDDDTRDLLAFDQKELDAMLPTMAVEVVEDEVPEQVEPRTKPGDLWLLGAYFECEDCGKRFDYEEGNALGGECPCG